MEDTIDDAKKSLVLDHSAMSSAAVFNQVVQTDNRSEYDKQMDEAIYLSIQESASKKSLIDHSAMSSAAVFNQVVQESASKKSVSNPDLESKNREDKWLKQLEIVLNEEESNELLKTKNLELNYNQIRIDSNKAQQPIDENFGHVKTVQSCIDLFVSREFATKKEYFGGQPYKADDIIQIHYWDNQSVAPTKRKIMISMPDGIDKESPSYNHMQQTSTSKVLAAENKASGDLKRSVNSMGHDQTNSMESESIYLLLQFIHSVFPTFGDEWETDFAFDGLQCDWFIRRKVWPSDEYVAIQQKSASIKFGKQTRYNIATNQYDERLYCIAVGLLDYVHNNRPEHFDDIRGNASIFEIIDMGKSSNCNPTPGIEYSSINVEKRLYVSHARAGIDDPATFVNTMLNNIETWQRMSREKILFDMDDINKESDSQKRTEMKGIEKMNSVVVRQGGFVRAPRRQNETVDSVIVLGNQEIGISNKTASIKRGDSKQRYFSLKAAPFNEFASVIVAFYADDCNKFAVIPSVDVYNSGAKNFCWNENHLKKNVSIFDVSSDAGGAAFIQCIRKEFRKRNATDGST